MAETKRQYSVPPDQIDTTKHFFDAFDNTETEVSARYIVRMLQKRGSWEPFTHQEIEKFYQSCGLKDGFTFNRLIEPGVAFGIKKGRYLTGGGWVVHTEDGKLEVTEDFVDRCFKSSPRITPKSN